jgi:hypothetical protein
VCPNIGSYFTAFDEPVCVTFSYKAAGANQTDEYGNLDTVEFLKCVVIELAGCYSTRVLSSSSGLAEYRNSVARDDALSRPEIACRTYPPCVEERMPAIRKFIEASDNINRTLMDLMSDRLGLPVEILRERHDPSARTPSESRIIRNPPKPLDKVEVAIGSHTDFGSLVSNSSLKRWDIADHSGSHSFIIY